MRKLTNTIIIIINIFILIELFINKELIFNTIGYSLNIWIKTLVPTLFPFFIIAEILISYNTIYYIPNFIKTFLSKTFNINDYSVLIFFLSLISGFPSNARNTRLLYDKNLINTDEANHILMFTHFANPLFVISTIGLSFFHNKKIALIILISHYFSNILLGILLRNNKIKKEPKKELLIDNNPLPIFGNIFTKAIKNSIDNLLTILGTLTCFLIFSNIIINTLNLNNYNSMLIKGILEITMGLKDLGILPLSDIYKTVIATSFISFGGLSIHMQVITQISDTPIKYRYFFIGRIYQTLLSIFISFILFIFLY